MAPNPFRRLGLLAAGLVALACSGVPAAALPAVDKVPADVTVEDADDRRMKISELKGRPVIVFYEDKDSGAVNQKLKEELGRWTTKDPELKAALVVAPIADVSEFNGWPAKGFAKDAIREESKKSGVTIWCDWDASFRKVYELRKGTSNVIVLGREGTVRFAAEGALTESQRKTVESLVRQEAAKKSK